MMIYSLVRQGGVYTCFGEGPIRPIVVEAETMRGALTAYEIIYGRQYEQAECATGNGMEFEI